MDDDVVVPFKTADGQVGDGAAIDPDLILENAKGDFLQVVVVGFNKDGQIEMRSSHSSRDALWIIRKGEHHLLFETE